jgi:hypothetical protein
MKKIIHLFAKILLGLLLIIDVLIVGLIIYLYFTKASDDMWGPAWSSAFGFLGIPAVFLTLLFWLMVHISRPKSVTS